MCHQTRQDQEKIDAYLDIIQERILAPVQNTEIRLSCTATLLLLFAAIDGLGKLLHPDDKAGSNERIRRFLDYVGGDYAVHKKRLLGLRHSLVHNAINLDGGGSSTMVIEKDGKPVVLNSPIEGGLAGRERLVANHFGIEIK